MTNSKEITVAIVDDDESVGRSLGRLLRTEGMKSTAYLSAEAFLEATPRPSFDCLVLDVRLTGISGMELHQRLIAAGEKTPVIFLTAHDDPKECEQALANGCSAYLRKTDPGTDVIGAIKRSTRTFTS